MKRKFRDITKEIDDLINIDTIDKSIKIFRKNTENVVIDYEVNVRITEEFMQVHKNTFDIILFDNNKEISNLTRYINSSNKIIKEYYNNLTSFEFDNLNNILSNENKNINVSNIDTDNYDKKIKDIFKDNYLYYKYDLFITEKIVDID